MCKIKYVEAGAAMNINSTGAGDAAKWNGSATLWFGLDVELTSCLPYTFLTVLDVPHTSTFKLG